MAIIYPYIPEGKEVKYVSLRDPFMLEAKNYACAHSLDRAQPTGSIVVKDGKVIGRGANGSDHHQKFGCERKKRGIPTGQNYELCEGCHPKNHSEPRAIQDAQNSGYDTTNSDLYLWGHWWFCEPCWQAITKGRIRQVYLLEGSERLFNRESPENLLGKLC